MIQRAVIDLLEVVLILSGITLGAVTVCGFVVSLVLALFQIQEQVISYVAKLAACVGIWLFCGTYFESQIINLFNRVIICISTVK